MAGADVKPQAEDLAKARNTKPLSPTSASRMGMAALAYARKNIPVFRLRPRTKEPFHGSRGFYDATTDLETVRRWWRESPDANIGIPTGERSGWLVLDVDAKENGVATLFALEERHECSPNGC